ncbi:hypothetical protein J0S82_019219 [Galemys pyrenaicus]|uniref:Uncharacterized protein n=1 Tax=Galemys pyrenaicus TaxID=202257 RepID=A0A8J6AAY1_GALPY|nr:hypothetical protein J0S82_019219 [Galemys pyrenaicus]
MLRHAGPQASRPGGARQSTCPDAECALDATPAEAVAPWSVLRCMPSRGLVAISLAGHHAGRVCVLPLPSPPCRSAHRGPAPCLGRPPIGPSFRPPVSSSAAGARLHVLCSRLRLPSAPPPFRAPPLCPAKPLGHQVPPPRPTPPQALPLHPIPCPGFVPPGPKLHHKAKGPAPSHAALARLSASAAAGADGSGARAEEGQDGGGSGGFAARGSAGPAGRGAAGRARAGPAVRRAARTAPAAGASGVGRAAAPWAGTDASCGRGPRGRGAGGRWVVLAAARVDSLPRRTGAARFALGQPSVTLARPGPLHSPPCGAIAGPGPKGTLTPSGRGAQGALEPRPG